MGGDISGFDEEKYYRFLEDLDKVNFCIYFAGESNLKLFDGEKLYSSLCKKTERYLKENGIKFHNFGPADLGGGGIESLRDIFKSLVDNLDFLKFLSSILLYLRSVHFWFLNSSVRRLKPRICITMRIESDLEPGEGVPMDFLEYEISTRLSNLLLIADSVATLLCTDYGYLCCDVHIAGNIKFKDYSIGVDIPHELRNLDRYPRLLQRIKDLKIVKNLRRRYEFAYGIFIRRIDDYLDDSGSSTDMSSTKTTYSLL